MRVFVAMGAICAFLAVALGAFGAHALQKLLEDNGTVATYQTAAHYHLTHALALLLVALLGERGGITPKWKLAGWLLILGIVLFSGSLYLLAVTNVRVLGAITPLGGVCFLLAWALIAVSALQSPPRG